MPRLTPEQQIERARQDKAKAEAKIRAASAKIREADRRADTRRKILIGAAFIAKAAQNESYARALQVLIKEMPDRDRSLFDDWKMNA